jgi:hypothetical protein
MQMFPRAGRDPGAHRCLSALTHKSVRHNIPPMLICGKLSAYTPVIGSISRHQLSRSGEGYLDGCLYNQALAGNQENAPVVATHRCGGGGLGMLCQPSWRRAAMPHSVPCGGHLRYWGRRFLSTTRPSRSRNGPSSSGSAPTVPQQSSLRRGCREHEDCMV